MSRDQSDEERLNLIRERLNYKKMGTSHLTLPRLDFDSYVVEDVEWLLDIATGEISRVEALVREANKDLNDLRDRVLENLPDYVRQAESRMSEAKGLIQDVNDGVDKFGSLISRLRDEIGLFDKGSDLQLYATRKELDRERAEKGTLETEIQRLRSRVVYLESRESSLISDLNKKEDAWVEKTAILRNQIKKLPPTWQERVAIGSHVLPNWVEVGVTVRSTKRGITGDVEGFDLETVRVNTELGKLTCPSDKFPGEWVKVDESRFG